MYIIHFWGYNWENYRRRLCSAICNVSFMSFVLVLCLQKRLSAVRRFIHNLFTYKPVTIDTMLPLCLSNEWIWPILLQGRMRGAFLLVVDSPSSICISNFQRKSVGISSTVQILPPASELLSPGQPQPEVTSSSGHQRSQATLLLVQWRTSKGQF